MVIQSPLPPCRFSGSHDLELIMAFGETPIADKLVDKPGLPDDTITAPLNLVFSPTSMLLQITDTVPAAVLYDENYPYFSSVSTRLLQHFKSSAERIIELRQLSPDNLVIEAASNDGYMLKNFITHSIPVLGIEPARLQADTAVKNKIPTLNTFFSDDLAHGLCSENRMADVFIANNVLAHAENLNDFVAGIATILKPDGLAVIEVPYVVDMVGNSEFDTVYHQHIYYFSLLSLTLVFEKYHLYINHAEKIDIHGGSLRLFVEKRKLPDNTVADMLAKEKMLGLDKPDYYRLLDASTRLLKEKLDALIRDIKNSKKSIAAYGAAAKGTTFMSYMGLDADVLDYVVDLNPYKQGKFMPGNHLEIFPINKLLEERPDYTLILTWNFADEIIQQMQTYLDKGGHFIVAIPELRVI